jgi:hypothetical protein
MKATIPTVQEYILGNYKMTQADFEAVALYNGQETNGYKYVRPSAVDDKYKEMFPKGSGENDTDNLGNTGDVQNAIVNNPATLMNNVVWNNFVGADTHNVDGGENVNDGSFPVNPGSQDPRGDYQAIGNHNLLGGQWSGWQGKANQFESGTGPDTWVKTPAPAPVDPKSTRQAKFDPATWVRSGTGRMTAATKSAASSRAIVQKEKYDSSKDKRANLGQQTPASHSAMALKSVMRAFAFYQMPDLCSSCDDICKS